MIYDISIPLSPEVAGWPGDTLYNRKQIASIPAGSTVNLSALEMSVHSGTHADAPIHFLEGARGAEALDLEPFIGLAYILDVSGINPIRPEHLPQEYLQSAPRLLLRTNAWPDVRIFPESVPVLAPETPSYLASNGIILLGLDIPSVDELESKDLPIHHALSHYNIQIIESLRLADVEVGLYELLALPLSLNGSDGAPLRAVVRTL